MEDLVEEWAARCGARGVESGLARCHEATVLVREAASSLVSGTAGTGPREAARNWAKRAASPVEVVLALAALRKVLSDWAQASSATASTPPGPELGVHALVDELVVEATRASTSALSEAARTDPLTGCANRRALEDDIARAVAGAGRSGADLAVAVIDLDGLKKLNDTFGHAAGDAALVALVESLRSSIRDTDAIYRTGGDEFVVLAPFSSAAGALEMLRRASALPGTPSFSFGVASLSAAVASQPVLPPAGSHGTTELANALLVTADEDLYARRRAARARRTRQARRVRYGALAVAGASAAAALSALAVGVTSGHQAPSNHQAAAGNHHGRNASAQSHHAKPTRADADTGPSGERQIVHSGTKTGPSTSETESPGAGSASGTAVSGVSGSGVSGTLADDYEAGAASNHGTFQLASAPSSGSAAPLAGGAAPAPPGGTLPPAGPSGPAPGGSRKAGPPGNGPTGSQAGQAGQGGSTPGKPPAAQGGSREGNGRGKSEQKSDGPSASDPGPVMAARPAPPGESTTATNGAALVLPGRPTPGSETAIILGVGLGTSLTNGGSLVSLEVELP
jgi:diguanylate cyclase (GGDEF)-like protein